MNTSPVPVAAEDRPAEADAAVDAAVAAVAPSIRAPSTLATRAVLVSFDVLACLVAARLAVGVWRVFQPLANAGHFYHLWPLLVAVPVGFAFLGLYPAAGHSPVEELRRTSLFLSALFGSTVAALFLAGHIASTSRGFLFITWGLVVTGVPLGRALARALFARRRWWGLSAVVLGAGRTAELLITHLSSHPGLDLKVLACLDDDAGKHGLEVAGAPVLGPLADAPQLRQALSVEYGIVAMPGVQPERVTEVVRRYAHVFPHLVVVPNVFGLTSVGVGTRDLGGFVGLYNKQNLLLGHNRVLKRAMDLVLLVPALAVGVPVMALAALATFLASPGNPFFAQRREGYRGKPIAVYKLRTMRRDADAALERYLASHPQARAEWQGHFKLARDPRVIPVVGGLLRRASIDELPQLFNILKGEMSFVGPRPFPYYHLEQFGAEFRELRRSVLPGLTGQWQVTSRSTADLEAQVQLDSYYIRNWSLWMDIYLLFATPWAVLRGKGAY
ncbi:MAG: exopolysaccharide biosynthesis polyprenyl glycosylphosphotransferase [Deinococcales bacterium]